jgi:hypothetical protein
MIAADFKKIGPGIQKYGGEIEKGTSTLQKW